MTFSALVVDDEPLARDGLKLLLAGDPEFGAVTDARGGREAIAAIERARPDVVFLDVQMPEVDGLAVVAAIGAARMPPVVFATAHDDFAMFAFEINAVDYLLKPIVRARFADALARVKRRLRADAAPQQPQQLGGVLALRDPDHARPARFAIREVGKVSFVDVDQIDWISAAENYVELHTASGTHLLQVGLSALDRALDPAAFVRVHRSAIVRVARIASLRALAHGEYEIALATGAKLRSGRTYHDAVKALVTNRF